MTHKPPNDPTPIPNQPFPSENEMAEEHARVLKVQRKEAGNLPDQPDGMPVADSKPFKKLKHHGRGE